MCGRSAAVPSPPQRRRSSQDAAASSSLAAESGPEAVFAPCATCGMSSPSLWATAICHSHDFLDANMAMDEVFTEALGRSVDADVAADAELWNAAWTLAKGARFFTNL